ncbi:MAG: DUF4388 domain-containing protein [Acidobacteria bacterium]|nr:DUF4388 domain-containing protein [Acidobacteriota bacterium]MBI3655731.1 DUF4388 domain-containing protein [Acidobacteriota bacterium]
MSKKERCIRKAESYVLASRIDKGVEAYMEAFESDSSDFQALILAGDLLIKLGNDEQAYKVLLRAARGYSAQGRLSDTIRIYRKINRIRPADIEVVLTLAGLYQKTNLPSDAVRFLMDGAKLLLENRHTDAKGHAHIQQLINLVQTSMRSRQDAELVIVQAHLYERIDRQEEAYALYWQGATMLEKEGKLERSLVILDHLLEKRPTDIALVEMSTSIMTKLGRSPEALFLQKQLLEKNSEDPRLLRVMINTLIALEKYDEAEAASLRLYGLDKTFYNEFLQFVYLLVSRQEFNRALRGIREMVSYSSYLQKTELAYLVKRILGHEPDHIPAMQVLAEIYERYDDITQALKVYPLLFDALYRARETKEAYRVGQRMVELGYKERSFLKNYDKVFMLIAGGPEASACDTEPCDEAGNQGGGNGDRTQGAESATKMTWALQSGQVEGEESLTASVDLLVRYGHLDNAMQVLKSYLETEPRSLVLRDKLKSVYLTAKLMSNAAKECIELYKQYLERGMRDKAQESLREALKLEPTLSLKSLDGGRESVTGFVGDFGLFTIVEVIQFIENSCKTGILKIVSATEEGRLLFNSGQVVDAMVGDKGGIQALYHLIRVEVGSYEFEPRKNKFAETIHINTMNLLLEGLRLLDEERARQAVAH